jgi:pyruvate kinase
LNDTRTKIVCTIGPSSRDEETVRALVNAGMDVARINFSHGTKDEHAENIDTIRRI